MISSKTDLRKHQVFLPPSQWGYLWTLEFTNSEVYSIFIKYETIIAINSRTFSNPKSLYVIQSFLTTSLSCPLHALTHLAHCLCWFWAFHTDRTKTRVWLLFLYTKLLRLTTVFIIASDCWLFHCMDMITEFIHLSSWWITRLFIIWPLVNDNIAMDIYAQSYFVLFWFCLLVLRQCLAK